MNKVIDAGALIDALEHEEERILGLDKVIEVIDNQPSAIKDTSVEELVHCKDCKYSLFNDDYGAGKCTYRTREFLYVEDDDFCSYGEREKSEE